MPRDVEAKVSLTVNGAEHDVVVDTRTTLLDGLRDRLGIYSPKKGCDHGQCGSCTVLADGRRIVSCLSFAVSYEGSDIRSLPTLLSHIRDRERREDQQRDRDVDREIAGRADQLGDHGGVGRGRLTARLSRLGDGRYEFGHGSGV